MTPAMCSSLFALLGRRGGDCLLGCLGETAAAGACGETTRLLMYSSSQVEKFVIGVSLEKVILLLLIYALRRMSFVCGAVCGLSASDSRP